MESGYMRDELEDFITYVSTFHPALQFIHTISQTQIPFLGITFSVSGGRISTSAHYKTTDTHNYLHYSSSHFKMVFPSYSQFLRLRRLCFEGDDFLQKFQEMSTIFESRGYPSDLLQNARKRVSSVIRQEALEKCVRDNKGRVPLVLTYHRPLDFVR